MLLESCDDIATAGCVVTKTALKLVSAWVIATVSNCGATEVLVFTVRDSIELSVGALLKCWSHLQIPLS